MQLSIGYISCREKACIGWFLNSILGQKRPDDEIEFIVVSDVAVPGSYQIEKIDVTFMHPKPSVWSGRYRVTQADCWSKSGSLNTFLCYAKHPHILVVDDRSVVALGFLDAVRQAVDGGYAMCGAYEKREGMTVNNGIIMHSGIVVGQDDRELHVTKNFLPNPYRCPGGWFYGCVNVMPLEWALEVNGWSETWCDGMGMEDSVMGLMLEKNGFPIKYDLRARLIEDRTPEFLGATMKRDSQERFPKDVEDKPHKVLEFCKTYKKSPNPFGDLRKLRNLIQSGGKFPLPVKGQTYLDWFSGKPINEFK